LHVNVEGPLASRRAGACNSHRHRQRRCCGK
jgi:hypothetical protein